jgi:hypothetical protein
MQLIGVDVHGGDTYLAAGEMNLSWVLMYRLTSFCLINLLVDFSIRQEDSDSHMLLRVMYTSARHFLVLISSSSCKPA